MHTSALLGIAILASTAIPSAQSALGYTTGTASTNVVSRGFTDRTEEVMSRIDRSDYAGIGVDAASPNRITLLGARASVYDFERATADPFYLVVRSEGANADLPDYTSAPATRVGPFQIQPNAGPGGANVLVSFATPVTVPQTQDLFVGLEWGPMTDAPTNDGAWVFAVVGAATGARFDLGGPGIDRSSATSDSYGSVYDLTNGQQFVFSRRYFVVDPIVYGAGGVCATVTNQPSMVSSGSLPGIAGSFSGLHPDMNEFTAPGRFDLPGYSFDDPSMARETVFFIISGGGLNPNPIALGAFIPGSTGAVCLNDAGLVAGSVVANQSGHASLNALVSRSIARTLGGSGLKLQWFAVAFDGTRFSGAPCAEQTY